ncbi:MAG: PHP domain-containing protein [Kiritimatiellia bacterium]|jgi:predicted metal-dependent phosphoesterase TrpH
MIDLHIHSTASDGSDTPEEIAAKAHALGLGAAAVTDHDNLGGVERFLAACRSLGLTGFSGVEVSAQFEDATIHILGYGVDPTFPELVTQFGTVLGGRDDRNRRILANLAALGLPLDPEEVAAFAGSSVVGRPHIARAMVARGYVASIQEAFDRYLGAGCAAYSDRVRLPPGESIRLIRAAGGVAVWAHPFLWSEDPRRLDAAIGTLKELGLSGIEAYYTTHGAEMLVTALRLARQHGLLVTGGSDYHGASTPDIAIGRGFGNLDVPDSLLPPLLEAIPPSDWVVRAS